MRPVAELLKQQELGAETILVSTTKGLEGGTLRTPAQIWREYFPQQPLAELSGPNLATEILHGLPTATVIASDPLAIAYRVQGLLACERFRVYVNQDLRGVELGGVLKNVIAISSGVSDGLGLGTNAKAALITRGLAEITRLGHLLGADPRTFQGLAGLGDLLTTCHSPLSRNYQVGLGLAQNLPLEQILTQIQGTAEGINTARVLKDLALEKQIELPIAHQVAQLLRGETTPLASVTALMGRGLKEERWEV